MPDATRIYLHSEVDQQKTSITYELAMTAIRSSGKQTEAKVAYDCTKLFDTHGYLHLREVHDNLV